MNLSDFAFYGGDTPLFDLPLSFFGCKAARFRKSFSCLSWGPASRPRQGSKLPLGRYGPVNSFINESFRWQGLSGPIDLDNIKIFKLRLFHRPKQPRLHLLGYLLSRFLRLTTCLKIDLMTIFSRHRSRDLVMLELILLANDIFTRDSL